MYIFRAHHNIFVYTGAEIRFDRLEKCISNVKYWRSIGITYKRSIARPFGLLYITSFARFLLLIKITILIASI
jgi:hypothetical protein